MSGYPCLHFSLCNPEGPSSSDLPLLLRRLADQLETEGITSGDVIALTVSGDEITEHGSWWKATVVWSPDDKN